MTISVRNVTSLNQGGSSDIILTKPTGVITGDVMYAFIHSIGQSTQVHVTLTGWTEVAVNVDSLDQASICVMRRVAGGAEGSTYTFNDGGLTSLVCGGIAAYIGVNNGTPEDATATIGGDFTNTQTALIAPSITTVTPNAWMVVCFMNSRFGGATTTMSLPTGFTNDIPLWGVSQRLQRVDHKAFASTGATGTATSTADVTSTYFSVTLALRPALPSGFFLFF
jgi:hypothetical protein